MAISNPARSSATTLSPEITILPSSFPPPPPPLSPKTPSPKSSNSQPPRAHPIQDPTRSATKRHKTSTTTSPAFPIFPTRPSLSAPSSTFKWVGPRRSSGDSKCRSSDSSPLARPPPPWSGALGKSASVISDPTSSDQFPACPTTWLSRLPILNEGQPVLHVASRTGLRAVEEEEKEEVMVVVRLNRETDLPGSQK